MLHTSLELESSGRRPSLHRHERAFGHPLGTNDWRRFRQSVPGNAQSKYYGGGGHGVKKGLFFCFGWNGPVNVARFG